MYILIVLASLYVLLLFLSSEGGAEWVRGKMASLQHKAMQVAANEQGQGLVEYALILVLVAIICIIILRLLGGRLYLIICYIVCIFQNGYGSCTITTCTVL